MLVITTVVMVMTGCYTKSQQEIDRDAQMEVTEELVANQSTPKDIEYSLQRYNLIKRAYWLNGMEEKARNLPCPVKKPLGYIILIDSGVVVNKYVVDGQVTSLNSYLTPDSEYYERNNSSNNKWLADVDGTFGTNNEGIFFFDADGEYHEWNGKYEYTSRPVTFETPALLIDGLDKE